MLEAHRPDSPSAIAADHAALEARIVDSPSWRDARRRAPVDARPCPPLYLELASFTGDYLDHQDFEERVVMPALEAAIGVEALLDDPRRLVASIPPDEMADALAVMLPAMNIDDRAELLGGMQAGAPAEVFAGRLGPRRLGAHPGRPGRPRHPPRPPRLTPSAAPSGGSPGQVMPDDVSHGGARRSRGSPGQVMPDDVSHRGECG